MHDRCAVCGPGRTQSTTKCDVVVVTFNSPPLPDTIWDLADDPRFNLLIVDNGSRRPPALKSSAANLIVNSKNVGFGGGCNTALTHGVAPYILFVNPDCVLPLDGALELVHLAQRRESMTQRPVVVGARAVGGGTQRVLPAGYSPSASRFLIQYLGVAAFSDRLRGFNVYDRVIPRSPVDVDWVGGGCMVISRSLFDALDGFDTGFFLYVEDVDLCLRARELGASIMLAGNVRARHPVGTGSEAGLSLRMAWLRNLRVLVEARYGRRARRRLDLALLFGAAIISALRIFGRAPTAGRPDVSMLVRLVFRARTDDPPSAHERGREGARP
jgi:GT2 family glycosyltransferase